MESEEQDPFALLRGDLAQTSALLRDCAAIARDPERPLGNRVPVLSAVAQLARANAQIGKLLANAPQPLPDSYWDLPRTSSHPPLQRALDRHHAEEDAKKAKTTAPKNP